MHLQRQKLTPSLVIEKATVVDLVAGKLCTIPLGYKNKYMLANKAAALPCWLAGDLSLRFRILKLLIRYLNSSFLCPIYCPDL